MGPRAVRFDRLPPGFRNELPDPRRADPEHLQREIRAASESPILTAVLDAADALVLVLNDARQVIGFNSRVAAIAAPEDVLGRRPGEALGCVNARGPGGCGTAPACRTCGALGAILFCRGGHPVESECLVQSGLHGGLALEFNVRASEVAIDGARFTVVSLRDISAQKRREVLEQVFFHDVLNTVGGLRGWALLLQQAKADPAKASDRIDLLSRQLEREIKDQRALLLAENGTLVPESGPVRPGDVLRDVAAAFAGQSVARDRDLDVSPDGPDHAVVTDPALLQRVLANMVRNALEATPPGGRVRAWWEPARDGGVRYAVHNAGGIPPEIQGRIFHRSFSTKAGPGRGLGTYSMRLFGEAVLGGRVSFTSGDAEGTVFSLALPAAPSSR